jgi:hypothetical protein
MEFSIEVNCPRCDREMWSHVEFGDDMFSPTGISGSAWQKETCYDCDKDFWFEASIYADVDFEQSQTRKPKGVRP